MTTGEPKMTEMSKPAEILYRAFFDELRFAKQQQWTVTNYTLLLMGAAYGLAKLTATSPPNFHERVAWCAVVAAVVALGLSVLIDLEDHLWATRRRQTEMENKFEPKDRELVGGKRYIFPQWFVFFVLCVVVIGAGILAGFAIWQLP
jgi:hypothetical protein